MNKENVLGQFQITSDAAMHCAGKFNYLPKCSIISFTMLSATTEISMFWYQLMTNLSYVHNVVNVETALNSICVQGLMGCKSIYSIIGAAAGNYLSALSAMS